MKRDMELVRKILILMSTSEQGPHTDWQSELPDYTAEQIFHHAHLMSQGGLIDVDDASSMDDLLPMALPLSITWNGHEFLDATRDPTLWEQARTTVLKPAGGVAFTVLLEWAKAESMRRLGMS
jgi:hypothetical protein